MGLDSVELVMDVEERFGIHIPDAEAAQIRTVGELYACVVQRLRRRKPVVCPSASVFYRLRRAMVNTCSVDRQCVRLDTPVSEILGDATPWRAWRNMQQELEFRLPQLCAPSWLSFAYGTIFVAVAVLGGWLVGAPGVLFFTPLSILPLLLLNIATRPLLRIPVGCETMKGLVAANALKLPTADDHEPTIAWDALCDIISNNLGVAKEKIRPETDFNEDLHLY